MKKYLFILVIMVACTYTSNGQTISPLTLQAVVVDGDTIPVILLDHVEVYALSVPKTKRERRKLTKLVRNVKKVYPWARLAGYQLRKYDKLLREASSDKERKKLMKQAEKEINEKYGGELRKLTFSQGKILIKLIDRETGNSSYELVQELRGKFTAFFYQAFARIWGYNLKVKYDPEGEDKQIETIVRLIERGQI